MVSLASDPPPVTMVTVVSSVALVLVLRCRGLTVVTGGVVMVTAGTTSEGISFNREVSCDGRRTYVLYFLSAFIS